MGYSNKLYFIEKRPKNVTTQGFENPDYWHAPVIATLEMGRFLDLHMLFVNEGKETDRFFFADDGNTEVVRDNYDEKLREISISRLCQFIGEEEGNPEENTEFREFAVLKKLAYALGELNHLYNNRIVVLNFGH